VAGDRPNAGAESGHVDLRRLDAETELGGVPEDGSSYRRRHHRLRRDAIVEVGGAAHDLLLDEGDGRSSRRGGGGEGGAGGAAADDEETWRLLIRLGHRRSVQGGLPPKEVPGSADTARVEVLKVAAGSGSPAQEGSDERGKS